VETAVEQELLEPFAVPGGQGMIPEEARAHLLVGLEDAPGEQGAHVELGHPGVLEQWQGQLKSQLTLGDRLGPGHEVGLVLLG
jgi:hypothetical protein